MTILVWRELPEYNIFCRAKAISKKSRSSKLGHLTTSASDGQKLGLLITPRSGNWGGAVYAMPGLLSGGKFLIPSGSGSFSDETEAAVEGRYSPGTGATIWLQFMPTGASAFPVRLMAVPH